MNPPTTAQLAEQRLKRLYEAIVRSFGGFLPLSAQRRTVLTPHERAVIAEFANSESLSDRTRQVSFEATDPRTGRKGTFTTSINNLLMIDSGYDGAKAAIQSIIGRLVRDGILSWDAPGTLPNPRMGCNAQTSDGVCWFGANHDTRLTNGLWADFPPYGGLQTEHITNVQATSLGYTPKQGRVLQGLPLPTRWRKLYPGPKLFDTREYSPDALITDLREILIHCQRLMISANANPEWHPAAVMFNNGVQMPSTLYPPDVSSTISNGVEARHQYKNTHRFWTMTRGASGSAAGFQMVGLTDGMWLHSNAQRTRIYSAQTSNVIFSNAWSSLHCADAIANFMQAMNMAQFLVGLGASAHVHASCEYHATLATKAYDELGLRRGESVDQFLLGLQRERDARLERQMQGGSPIETALVSAGVGQVTAAIISGGTIASMQLFMANPIAGAVALIITAVAAFIAWLVEGAPRPQIPENVLIRDGLAAIRPKDENDDPRGDVFGGNVYPCRRIDAIRGRPVIRAKDENGRLYE